MLVAGLEQAARPMTLLATTSTISLLTSALPKTPLLLAAASTALHQSSSSSDDPSSNSPVKNNIMFPLAPRAKSCIFMATAMAFHFGGYEFARSGALALFTSSETGFSHPSAYPLAIGLVTPVSLVLLYWYGLVLNAHGPRQALKTTSVVSVAFLTLTTVLLKVLEGSTSSPTTVLFAKALVGFLLVFQNSYAHLLYTQQWSFLGSVMTPSEGTKWFSFIAGLSSLVCTMTATMVHNLASVVGLLGLIVGTCLTLTISLFLADQAYRIGEENGFDPSETMQRKKSEKDTTKDGNTNGIEEKDPSLLSKTAQLFRQSPTLAALFGEVIAFQSLSTVLNVCFVRQLKESMPLDTDRASFTGQFYACVNGSSGLMQFFVLPLARKYLEPKWAYRLMPLVLLPLLMYSALQASSLWVAATAFFCLKTLDYSLRNVVSEMVYQPLDFESRYLGKEVIGVFANRFGKSGMSMILSLVTPLLGVGVTQLSQLAVGVASLWASCSVWLSHNVVSNQEAERRVQARQSKKTE